MPKLNNKVKAFLVIAVAVVVVAGLFTVSRWWGLSGSVSDWFVIVEAETLVRSSEHIVIGRYVDETIYEVPNPSTAHVESPTFSVDVYRRFEVLETLKGSFAPGDVAHVALKGSFAPGDVAHVAWNVGYYKKRQEDEGQIFIPEQKISLSPGEEYVLFLNRRHGRRPDSMDVKIRVWRTAEGLEVAQTDSEGRLTFQTTRYYQAALNDMGLKPIQGSGGALFELTVAEIRTLVASPASDQR